MTVRNEDIKHTAQMSKTKPNMFHEAFYKTGIDPEGLTRITPKLKQNMTKAKETQSNMLGVLLNLGTIPIS